MEWLEPERPVSLISLCEKLHKREILGASFFCSRSASQEVRDARFIIPTIASTLSCVWIKYFCEIFMELAVVGASVNHHDQNRDIDTGVR